ncbi:hypothetical protein EXIGLDRAFT_33875 [Exidia glandulosa HHB12029]|uniref:Uncharacterized protein n=1 Tax=Exidia glandulosa HHB12029 TaxID=1314781 RepID=A0A166MUZ2_EXIGL|nr:hypothetical protein EXIGLDRAFT_33875 [Exidia glandulosa HHB12029]
MCRTGPAAYRSCSSCSLSTEPRQRLLDISARGVSMRMGGGGTLRASCGTWYVAYLSAVGTALMRFFKIMKGEWSAVIRLVQALSSQLELATQKTVMALAIPKLFDRIANTPGPSAADQPKLVQLLEHLSSSHKQLFYKPVILCAAATKDMTVIGHLHVLQALARLLPDFWIGDAELMAIALLSDNSAPPKGGKRRSWGATKVGQCVLASQIIEDMRKRSEAKAERVKKDKGISESARQPEHAYLLNLEDRITVLLDAREKVTLLPFSQRLLIVTLLHEIRSYTLGPARLS